MLKRIVFSLLALAIFLLPSCANSTKSNQLTNPPGHADFEALIGLQKQEALEKIGLNENDLTTEVLPNVYASPKNVEFAGVNFNICFGVFPEDIISSVYYIANYEDDLSNFSKDALAVAKALENNLPGENLTKDISQKDMSEAFAKSHQEDDHIDISKSAPKNVKEYMEYIIYTDYWKDFHYLTDKIPLPAGYFCKFIVSLDSETQKGVIHIQYHVSTIPGTYSTSVTE